MLRPNNLYRKAHLRVVGQILSLSHPGYTILSTFLHSCRLSILFCLSPPLYISLCSINYWGSRIGQYSEPRMRMPSAIAFLIFSIVGLQAAAISSDGQDLKYRKFVTDATELPEIEEEYDFIVVGGGTAGCPLAATLSTHYSVLVLERGGDAQQHPNVLSKDEMFSNLKPTDGEDSPAEPFTSKDGVANTRGRILGGSSMVNFGFYSRADPDFYASSGIDWDMDAVNRSYQWVEEVVVTRPDLDTTSADARKALLEAGVLPDNGFTFEHLQGTKTGGSTFDNNGRRHGAVDLLSKATPTTCEWHSMPRFKD